VALGGAVTCHAWCALHMRDASLVICMLLVVCVCSPLWLLLCMQGAPCLVGQLVNKGGQVSSLLTKHLWH
jgi:hypothetical protein